jgi:hypothetical protein
MFDASMFRGRLGAVLMVVSAACARGEAAELPRKAVDDNLAAVREATARFADFQVAQNEGWTTEVTQCMESDRGGQGYHYGNPGLIQDGGKLDILRPELLMYEPQADGSMAYVGIEYIIPVGDWTADSAPELLGRALHVNERFGVWVLHVWWRDNPSGQFTDFNPAVTCAYEN